MKFDTQLQNMFEIGGIQPATVRYYLRENCLNVYKEMMESMADLAKSEAMSCCVSHRALIMMKIWCGGISVFIRAYQMYGMPDDIREILTLLGPDGDLDD